METWVQMFLQCEFHDFTLPLALGSGRGGLLAPLRPFKRPTLPRESDFKIRYGARAECESEQPPRWEQVFWVRNGRQSGPGSIAENSLKNFNSRCPNALPREGEWRLNQIENLQLTKLAKDVT